MSICLLIIMPRSLIRNRVAIALRVNCREFNFQSNKSDHHSVPSDAFARVLSLSLSPQKHLVGNLLLMMITPPTHTRIYNAKADDNDYWRILDFATPTHTHTHRHTTSRPTGQRNLSNLSAPQTPYVRPPLKVGHLSHLAGTCGRRLIAIIMVIIIIERPHTKPASHARYLGPRNGFKF